MLKYILPLLLTTAVFAENSFDPDPVESYEWTYRDSYIEKKVRCLDVTEILDTMETLVSAAQGEPHNLYIFIFMMEEEINKCKTWMSLQHSY